MQQQLDGTAVDDVQSASINQFLSHIRETDAIVNVVRCFEDPNVIHVAGKVSPIDDIIVIQTELALADLGTVEKAIHRENKKARSGDKDAAKLVALLEKVLPHLNQGLPVRILWERSFFPQANPTTPR